MNFLTTIPKLRAFLKGFASSTAVCLLVAAILHFLHPNRDSRIRDAQNPAPGIGSSARMNPVQLNLTVSEEHSPQILSRPDQSPPWAIPYGKEFWRQPGSDTGSRGFGPASSLALKNLPGLNLQEVIERISLAFATDPSFPTARLQTPTYWASFDGEALRFTASDPEGNKSVSQTPRSGEAVFRTDSVRLGDQTLFQRGPRPPISSVLGNTAQALLDAQSGLVEHFETRSDGVAVTWIFPQPVPLVRPAPNGPQNLDLFVEAEIEGLKYASQTANGHHFADAEGIARLVVGNAKLVDASGRNWSLPVTVKGNRVGVRVSADILGQAEYPIAVDPIVGPEFGVDNPIFSPSTATQVVPAIASNGTNYLVAWENSFGRQAGTGVLGSRVGADGNILDVTGIAINLNPPIGVETFSLENSTVRAASDGHDYLVVWQETRLASNTIASARVSGSGTLLDTNRIVVRQGPSSVLRPAVAGNTNGYLVAWQDARNGTNDIYGARISSSGALLDTNNIPISRVVNAQTLPSVAAGIDNYLVVWQDARNVSITNSLASDIYATRINPAGQVMDTNGFRLSFSAPAFAPAAAASGNDFFVAWQVNIVAGTIRGARVTPDALVLDTNLVVSGLANRPQAPAVAASGGQYLIVWQASARTNFTGPTNIFGNIVSPSGRLMATNGFAIGQSITNQILPAVAGNGTNFFVVWQDLRISGVPGGNLFGTPVTAAGTVINPKGAAIAPLVPNVETTPAVAFDGSKYLAIWSDSRNPASPNGSGLDIYGARIATNGAVLDPNGIAISRATNTQSMPALSGANGMFLAVWVDQRFAVSGTPGDIFGARITDDGTVLDTNGITICTLSTIQTAPAVQAGSNGFLVVWANQRPSLTVYDLFGTPVTTAGTVSYLNGIAFNTNASGIGQGFPSVAYNGSLYLVAWADARNISASGYDILGTRVTSLGLPIDLNPLVICSRPGLQTDPAVASNGTDFLATWSDFGSTPPAIFGARVSAGGAVLDPNGFPLGSVLAADYPAAASDGADYLVIWQEAQDIRGARVSSAGLLWDHPSLAIDTNVFAQSFPALAYGGGQQFLAVSQGTLFKTNRTVAEFITLNRPPVATPQSVSVNEDTPVNITLTGADPDGDPLTYTILTQPTNGTLSGVAPNLAYLARTNYNGPDSFTFKVNDGKLDSPPATVSITVVPVNDPPVAIASVSPLFAILPGDTNQYILSPNGIDATVILDGTQSYDVDSPALQYFWHLDGQTNVFTTGSLSTNVLPVGSHTIQLVVSDGQATNVATLAFEIISPAHAIAQLVVLVGETLPASRNPRPLLASLAAAAASFERGNSRAALNQLGAFQNKILSQVAPGDPALANQYNSALSKIINIVNEP
jgi:hypothetical protein